VTPASGIWLLVLTLALVGLALGIQSGPLISVAVSSVSVARAGTASSLINVARLVGATLGVAVLGSIFATLSGGAQTPELFLVGFRGALLAGAVAELLGSAVALVIFRQGAPGTRRSRGWQPSREVRDYV
jgi:MFS family permease